MCCCSEVLSRWLPGDFTHPWPAAVCGSRICWAEAPLVLGFGWNLQPSVQETLIPTCIRPRFGTCSRRIHLAFVMRQQFSFVVADGRGILPQIAGTEDAARQLLEFLFFNRTKETQADLGFFSDVIERDSGLLSEPREVEPAGGGRV